MNDLKSKVRSAAVGLGYCLASVCLILVCGIFCSWVLELLSGAVVGQWLDWLSRAWLYFVWAFVGLMVLVGVLGRVFRR